MDVGIHIIRFEWPGGAEHIAETLGSLVSTAEAVGCDSVSVMDHFFQMERYFPIGEPMLESYVTLGYLAARTHVVKLRTLVSGVTYRHPGLLAKIVTTLDVVSGGRGELGIGAAWYEREHRGLGVPFPSVSERFERLEETLQICLQMWSDDDGPYEGRHYQLAETLCVPKPLTRPRPAIMIGGGGEKKTLKLVAKYADACNLFTPSVDEVRQKLDVLRRHCVDEGRDYDSVRKTILYTGSSMGDAERFVDEMGSYRELGVDAVMVMPEGVRIVEDVERIGREIIPKVNAL